MREWLKANGGPAALVIVGVVVLLPSPIFGALLIVAGFGVWLNRSSRFPWKVVRESRLTLGVTDVNFTYGAKGSAGIQVNAWVRNLGAPTILHSWELRFQIRPDEDVRTVFVSDWHPEGMLAHLDSLTDKTRREPLDHGTEKGLVCFALPDGLTAEMVDQAQQSGAVTLLVSDQAGRPWQVRQGFAELAELNVQREAPSVREMDSQKSQPVTASLAETDSTSGARLSAPRGVEGEMSAESSDAEDTPDGHRSKVRGFRLDLGPAERDPEARDD